MKSLAKTKTMKMKPEHQPIQHQYRKTMEEMGKMIDQSLNPHVTKKSMRHTGFALFVFPFGQPNGERRANYICSAQKKYVLAMLKEFIARVEGKYQEPVEGETKHS